METNEKETQRGSKAVIRIKISEIAGPEPKRFPSWWLSEPDLQMWNQRVFEEDIKMNGVKVPLTVRKLSDGMYWVVNGRHRYATAKKLGIVDVPCYLE